MRSRCSFWWTWLCASLAPFVGQRLSAVGEIIAQELERSYASATGGITSSEREKKRRKSLVRFLWLGRRDK
jgi:hypothetical protein